MRAGWEKLTVEEDAFNFVTDVFECAFPPGEGRSIAARSPVGDFNYIFYYEDFWFVSVSVAEYAGHCDSAALATCVSDLVEVVLFEESCLAPSLVYLFCVRGRVMSTPW